MRCGGLPQGKQTPECRRTLVPKYVGQQPVVCLSLRDGPGETPRGLRGHFVVFTLNAVFVVLPACFVYLIAFRALLNVFVIRIVIGCH